MKLAFKYFSALPHPWQYSLHELKLFPARWSFLSHFPSREFDWHRGPSPVGDSQKKAEVGGRVGLTGRVWWKSEGSGTGIDPQFSSALLLLWTFFIVFKCIRLLQRNRNTHTQRLTPLRRLCSSTGCSLQTGEPAKLVMQFSLSSETQESGLEDSGSPGLSPKVQACRVPPSQGRRRWMSQLK